MQLKPVQEWDEDFIAALPAGELDWLEFKASDKFAGDWKMDASKYVSAWANYGGGYLIFGVKDPQTGTPLEIDGGVSASIKPNLATWLDQVIPALVEEPLAKLETWLVPPKKKDSKIKPGNVLIVIHVPESASAPHQALDHKYYQRLGRQLLPIKHRQVMDITGRRVHPEIETFVLVHLGMTKYTLFWRVTNVGRVIALHWKAVIKFPIKIGETTIGFKDEEQVIGGTEVEDDGEYLEIRVRRVSSPLFPGSDISASFEFSPCQYDPTPGPSIKAVIVTTYADEMPAKTETFPLDQVIRRHSR